MNSRIPRTRLQNRIAITSTVLLNADLLTCILVHVRGTSPRNVPRYILPRVCSEWYASWKIVVSKMSRSPNNYRFGLHLSIVQRESRIAQLRYANDEFHRRTRTIREHCTRILHRKLEGGAFASLTDVIIERAFSLDHIFDALTMTRRLFAFVVSIRTYVALQVATNPSRYTGLLPIWYQIHPDDVLHAALL